jgi:hypothetical protein
MSKIYPSSFNTCILSCNTQYNQSQNLLYFINSFDTLYIQLGFTDKMYDQGETSIYCDFIQARDGGFPFLILKDIILYKGESLKVNRLARMDILKEILNDPTLINLDETLNEFRLKTPLLFDCNEINDVFDNIIPNFYGITLGVEFLNDSLQVKNNNNTSFKKNQFIMRKTSYTDVYEFFINGIEKIQGNNIAYIPNIILSNKLSILFKKKNSIKIECEYNKERQKWTPIVN